MQEDSGSDYDRLFYPFLFEGERQDPARIMEQVRQSALAKCHETAGLRRKVLEESGPLIARAGLAMAARFEQGATLLAFGNGGSATDAQDLVINLLQPAGSGARPLPAIALAANIAMVTAVGNDAGFDNIFARQIIAFGRPGDIAFGISASGNSPNLLAAFEEARRRDLLTVGLAGYDGGKMARPGLLDFLLVVPSDSVTRIQDAQATVYHALLAVIQARLRKEL